MDNAVNPNGPVYAGIVSRLNGRRINVCTAFLLREVCGKKFENTDMIVIDAEVLPSIANNRNFSVNIQRKSDDEVVLKVTSPEGVDNLVFRTTKTLDEVHEFLKTNTDLEYFSLRVSHKETDRDTPHSVSRHKSKWFDVAVA